MHGQEWPLLGQTRPDACTLQWGDSTTGGEVHEGDVQGYPQRNEEAAEVLEHAQ